MLDYKEKKFIKKILYSKISIGIVLVLLVFVSRGTWSAYKEAKMTRENRDLIENELLDLVNRKDVIQDQIADLSTLEGKEKEIRSKFQVAKQGEEMVMIIQEEPEYIPTEEEKSFFEKLKGIFR